MNLFAHVAIDYVWERLTAGVRLLWPDEGTEARLLPNKSAICARRYQLGVRPQRSLLHRFCRPLATPAIPGAFLGSLRLMAIDGQIEDVPDTRRNAAVFGRRAGGRGVSSFPQVLCGYLCEYGRVSVRTGATPGVVRKRAKSGVRPC